MKNKCFIIMGMHKGGTSLTASLVDALGVDLGRKNYIGPDNINQRGYFENKEISVLNDALLNSAGNTWAEPVIISRPDLVNINEFKKDIWGWKDPRTAFTIYSYLPHIRESDLKLVFVKRNKTSNLRSLMKSHADQVDPRGDIKFFSEMYDIYWEQNKKLMAEFPHVLLKFENYFLNPDKELSKLKKFAGLDGDLNGIIEKKLKHF